jgi:tetratricopeptide (TPR) repeat protein
MVVGHYRISNHFPDRPFTPVQRLLTQPRVLLLYLYWIFVPMRSHLTLLHEINYSLNIMDPVSTLPALLALIGILVFLISTMRRFPLLSFCGLFFFINHLVEASFLNLEMIYEHRNYLPSMLLFVIPAAWIIHLSRKSTMRKSLRFGCLTAVVLFVLSNGHSVYAYNKVFRSELAMWLDVRTKSPGLSVVHNNLGMAMWKLSAIEEAHQQFQKAYQLDFYYDRKQKSMVYHNLGVYQAYVLNDYKKALSLFLKARDIANGYSITWYHIARCYYLLDDIEMAEKTLSQAIGYWPKDERLIGLAAVIDIVAGKLDEATAWAVKLETLAPSNSNISILLSEIHRRQGDALASKVLIDRYLKESPGKGDRVATLLKACRDDGNAQSCALNLLWSLGADYVIRIETKKAPRLNQGAIAH